MWRTGVRIKKALGERFVAFCAQSAEPRGDCATCRVTSPKQAASAQGPRQPPQLKRRGCLESERQIQESDSSGSCKTGQALQPEPTCALARRRERMVQAGGKTFSPWFFFQVFSMNISLAWWPPSSPLPQLTIRPRLAGQAPPTQSYFTPTQSDPRQPDANFKHPSATNAATDSLSASREERGERGRGVPGARDKRPLIGLCAMETVSQNLDRRRSWR